jgi:hypothetical protein
MSEQHDEYQAMLNDLLDMVMSGGAATVKLDDIEVTFDFQAWKARTCNHCGAPKMEARMAEVTVLLCENACVRPTFSQVPIAPGGCGPTLDSVG